MPDLKGCIFDVGQGQYMLYNESKKDVYNYAGKKYTSFVCKSLKIGTAMSYHYIKQPVKVIKSQVARVETVIFEQKVKIYVKKAEERKENMVKIFNTIQWQCTKEFIGRMRTYPEYNQAKKDFDPIKLLKIMQQILHNYDQEIYKPRAILLLIKSLLNCQQHEMIKIE